MKKLLDNKKYFFYFIWAFYCGGYFLFWASNLKRTFDTGFCLRIVNIVTLVCLLLYMVTIFFDRPKLKELIPMGVFAGVNLIVFLFFNRVATIPIMTLFILAAYRLDFYEFVRFNLAVMSLWLVIIILLYVFGVTGNIVGTYGEAVKEAMGFQHPNTFGMFCFVILLQFLFCFYKKMNVIGWAAVIALWYIVMDISASRTTGYSLALIILLFAIDRFFPNLFRMKAFRYLFAAVPAVLSGATVGLTYLYMMKNPLAIQLNHVLTGRLRLQAQYLQNFPIRLFGQDIDSFWLVLDNAYLRILLSYGVVFFVIFILLYTYIMYKSVESQKPELAFLILFFLLLGFGETSMIRVAINSSLLLFFNGIVFSKQESWTGGPVRKPADNGI